MSQSCVLEMTISSIAVSLYMTEIKKKHKVSPLPVPLVFLFIRAFSPALLKLKRSSRLNVIAKVLYIPVSRFVIVLMIAINFFLTLL